MFPRCSQKPYRQSLSARASRTFMQIWLRGAGGARTHDRRIMRSQARGTERATCTDTTNLSCDSAYDPRFYS